MKYLFSLMLFTLVAQAQITRSLKNEKPPLLELGVATIMVNVPDYPGSQRSQTYTIPVPTGLYRGDVLRADEEGGARARFFKNPNYELSFSGSITFSSNSSENPARTGMPDLDGLGEFGPSIIWRVKKVTDNNPWKINLSIPLRAAFSTDFDNTTGRGAVFNPFLFFIREEFLHKDMIFFFGTSARFATEGYMDYYYQVDSQYATATRPQYDAKGGYLQSSVLIGTSFRYKKNHTFFMGYQYLDLHGSKNDDSALLVKKSQSSWAAGYTWWFYESDSIGHRY